MRYTGNVQNEPLGGSEDGEREGSLSLSANFGTARASKLALLLLCLFAFCSPSFPQVAVALHANFDPDLTDNQPPVCVSQGKVAAPTFHFIIAYRGPVVQVGVDWVKIEELPEQHVPAKAFWQVGELGGGYGIPYGCTSLPVSDPQNWAFRIWQILPYPMVGFILHNTDYRVTVQWWYIKIAGLDPNSGMPIYEFYGPFQASITVQVENLVIESPDVGKVLRWDPERNIADMTIQYALKSAQRKGSWVRVRIYNMYGELVYEAWERKISPGSYSFSWDGSVNVSEGTPSQGQIAPSGLYTFDLFVMEEAIPFYGFGDGLRSGALRVEAGPIEYWGYDDGGTPEDESDDQHLYFLRWYTLYSDREASYGEIWLYDPDLERVKVWQVGGLWCEAHGASDGLSADPNGKVHGVILKVPVSLMQKPGIYYFVLHFYDSHPDLYKNHKVKAALEVNALLEPDQLHIWIDRRNTPDLDRIVYWERVGYAFGTIARLPTHVHRDPPAGDEEKDYYFGVAWGKVTVKLLDSYQRQRSRRRTVIATARPGPRTTHLGASNKKETKMTPEDPAIVIISTTAIDYVADLNNIELKGDISNIAYTNAFIHEITHVVNDKQEHCPQKVETCIWRESANMYFYQWWQNLIEYWYNNEQHRYWSPWHSLEEINAMRRSLRLPKLQPLRRQ